jgi:hypothetical protein
MPWPVGYGTIMHMNSFNYCHGIHEVAGAVAMAAVCSEMDKSAAADADPWSQFTRMNKSPTMISTC